MVENKKRKFQVGSILLWVYAAYSSFLYLYFDLGREYREYGLGFIICAIFEFIDIALLIVIGVFSFDNNKKVVLGSVIIKIIISIPRILFFYHERYHNLLFFNSHYLDSYFIYVWINNNLSTVPYLLLLVFIILTLIRSSEKCIPIIKKIRFVPAVVQLILAIYFNLDCFEGYIFFSFEYFVYFGISLIMDIVLAIAFYFLIDRILDPYKTTITHVSV